MNSDLEDIWDEKFLEEAIELETKATASSSSARPNSAASLSAVALSAIAIPAVASATPSTALASSAPPFAASSLCNPVPLQGSSSRTDQHFFNRPSISSRASIPPVCPRRPETVTGIRSGNSHSFPVPWDLSSYGIGGATAADCGEGFSPPRELSQRVPEPDDRNSFPPEPSRSHHGISREEEKEIERLKEELGRVSSRLIQLEQERSETQKERAKKDDKLKSAYKQIKAKNAEIEYLKSNLAVVPNGETNKDIELTRKEFTVHQSSKSSGSKRKEVPTDGSSAVHELKRRTALANGAQTSGESTAKDTKDEGLQTKWNASCREPSSISHTLSTELSVIWGSSINRSSRRNLISKLLVTCSEDICALFKCIGMEMSFSFYDKKFFVNDMDFPHCPNQSDSATKISKFCTKLLKMNKQMIEMDDLLEELSHLFVLDITVICRSLRILRAILETVLSWDDNSKQDHAIIKQQENSDALKQKIIDAELSDACSFLQDEKGFQNNVCIPTRLRLLIVKHMQKILASNSNEQILIEALSVLHLLIRESDPISEREMMGLIILRILPKLLHMDVGPHVQKQAVQILFLLLNCLNLLTSFCTGFKDYACEDEIDDQKGENQMKTCSLEAASVKILEGLVDCIKCGGDSVSELKLQMEVVNVLAFIAASGEHGFNIILRPVSPDEHNFLDLIIQVLAHQMDQEDNGLDKSVDINKERIALRREALILLNRLVSNSYSMHTLGALTRTYLSAGLAIDVVDRIAHRRKGRWKYGSMKSLQPMDDETIDLARSFGARVLAFIGE